MRAFTAVATYDRLADAVAERFGGISDSITLDFGSGTPPGLAAELISDLKKIPTAFTGFPDSW